MIPRALIFALITIGVTFVVGFIVAALIRLIAVTIQKRSAANNGSK